MAFATPRRVHFNREVAKWSAGRTTPSIQRLSATNPSDSTLGAGSFTNESMNDSIISTNESNMRSSRNAVAASAGSKPSDQNSLITVCIRVRPLNNREIAAGCTNSIHVSQDQKEITLRDKQNKHCRFTCDFAITSQQASNYASSLGGANTTLTAEDIKADSQQQFLYECIGKPLLNKAYEGYNASIFAYGQTGSGKTYSMIGTDRQPGLIPRFIDELFERKKQRDLVVSSTHIEISYYEIYNEKIYDLLRSSSDGPASSSSSTHGGPASTSNKHLQIRENPVTGPYIVDLLAVSVQTSADVKTWFDIGNKRRATACTNMNQKSSRSHSVFQIILTQMLEHTTSSASASTAKQAAAVEEGAGENSLLQLVTSKIYLVDLAGSERINTSIANLNGSEKPSSLATPSSSSAAATSSRFKESTCINKSLLTLGKIICLLSDRQQSSSSAGAGQGYLPYRESTLTWLLKESLGGNAKTAMLATVNASSSYFDETLCTLRYAAKTACIKNAAHLNRNFRQKYTNEFGEQMETNLVIPPLSAFDLSKTGGGFNSLQRRHAQNAELEMTLKVMEQEWKEKLEEAERLKQKEINDLERSLIVLYENETRAQNCCLINLNEDPLLSEKLIYLLKSNAAAAAAASAASEDKAGEVVTLIGSDKSQANIHLTGPLIAPLHSRIWTPSHKESAAAGAFCIEQIDANYVTYVNGEVLAAPRQLNHGDRIIFGGSHFFRFNNPMANKQAAVGKSGGGACSTPATAAAGDGHQFKDYQFAKNEIERKQNELIQEKLNEALRKCQQDGDIRLQELRQKYEQNIETIKSDLEREKHARKLELEQIKTESSKKLKQIVHKKLLIETKLSEIESEMAAANEEIDKHERDLVEETENLTTPAASGDAVRTPAHVNRRILSKLTEFCSEKKSSAFKSMTGQRDMIQCHANSSGLFAITLKVTEANKICNTIGFDFEFKRYEVLASGGGEETPNVSTSSLASLRRPNFIQMICVIDRRLNLATLWNLDTFDHKLNMLRDIYARFVEEDSLAAAAPGASSAASAGACEAVFITDSSDEWQTLDTFMRQDETFSPRVLENALSRNKQCKRRLSLLGSTNSTASCNSSISVPKQSESAGLDVCDSSGPKVEPSSATKRKCLGQIQAPFSAGPGLSKPFDFTMSLSNLNLHQNQAESDQDVQTQMCHSFVYATCRDALNDDDLQSDDEDEDDLDETLNEEEIDSLKFPDDSISTVEEPMVKCCARLVYNIEKLVSQIGHDASTSRKRGLNRRESTVLGEHDDDDAVSSVGGDLSSNDQPLYCMKITILCSQLSLFRPNSWCLNGENGVKIRYKWAQINKKIKLLKETVGCFYQSIENSLESMVKSKHEMLVGQLSDLMFMFGEYVFLACSNSYLNRDNYMLNAIGSKFLLQYAKGVDKQFEFYLNHKAAKFFNSQIPPIVGFIEKMQMFRMNYQRLKFHEGAHASHPADLVIDYCNYALQSHFRLTNSLKLLQQQIYFRKNNTEKIAGLFYNILTDSLALDTISAEEASKDEISLFEHEGDETRSEHKLSASYSNESFIQAFKDVKKYLHEEDLKLHAETKK